MDGSASFVCTPSQPLCYYSLQSSELSHSAKKSIEASRQAALYAQAQAPLKQMAMLGFMMWMTGTQLHLFSIMMTLSGIYQPLSAILKSKQGR